MKLFLPQLLLKNCNIYRKLQKSIPWLSFYHNRFTCHIHTRLTMSLLCHSRESNNDNFPPHISLSVAHEKRKTFQLLAIKQPLCFYFSLLMHSVSVQLCSRTLTLLRYSNGSETGSSIIKTQTMMMVQIKFFAYIFSLMFLKAMKWILQGRWKLLRFHKLGGEWWWELRSFRRSNLWKASKTSCRA